jgi:hypothetical protein
MSRTYEPPIVTIQQMMRRKAYRIAPGVYGYAFSVFGRVFIPTIIAVREGSGDVGRFLDRLTRRCTIMCVQSDRLRGMLVRRGWKYTMEPSDDGDVDMWVRE